MVVRKTPLFQERLGTNIGKVEREKERRFCAGSGQPKAALYWQWLINNLTQPELRPPPPPIPCDLLEVGKTHLL
jgi:hypothetical protein